MTALAAPGTVEWHDVECGGYVADLPLWRELAERCGGPVLDGGSGAGRVALELASRGHDVCAVDLDGELLAALGRRAAETGIAVEAHTGDLRTLRLGRTFALAVLPMQVIQLMGGPDGRARALGALRAHLAPGALLAAALADPQDGVPGDGASFDCAPDTGSAGPWRLYSTPVAVRRVPGGLAVDRHREARRTSGERFEERDTVVLDLVRPEELEREGREAAFAPAGRRCVPATDLHVASEVVLLEAV